MPRVFQLADSSVSVICAWNALKEPADNQEGESVWLYKLQEVDFSLGNEMRKSENRNFSRLESFEFSRPDVAFARLSYESRRAAGNRFLISAFDVYHHLAPCHVSVTSTVCGKLRSNVNSRKKSRRRV
jgi:hypothetical protein